MTSLHDLVMSSFEGRLVEAQVELADLDQLADDVKAEIASTKKELEIYRKLLSENK